MYLYYNKLDTLVISTIGSDALNVSLDLTTLTNYNNWEI